MDQSLPQAGAGSDAPSPVPSRPQAPARKRSSSGASGLLSKIPFMRTAGEHRPRSRRNTIETEQAAATPTFPPTPSFTTIPAEPHSRHAVAAAASPSPPLPPHIVQHQISQLPQQQKTRRRRGSLRKVALLGRGAQRERREGRGSAINTNLSVNETKGGAIDIRAGEAGQTTSNPASADGSAKVIPVLKQDGNDLPTHGLGISDSTAAGHTMHGSSTRSATASSDPNATPTAVTTEPCKPAAKPSPAISYSTTDDEDGLHMRRSAAVSTSASRPTTPSLSLSSSRTSLLRPERASLSSGSESYYLTLPHSHSHPRPPGAASIPSIQRRRSTIQRAKSPLALTSLAGLSTTPLPPPDADWDYSETEWWGWIILIVTWLVFVVGMGSCLGVWSWAWDVGTTPYAPPELEDDPTLPIVGYYPALMILTGVMAWVWVVVAWVGMKYFRHAQVSGD